MKTTIEITIDTKDTLPSLKEFKADSVKKIMNHIHIKAVNSVHEMMKNDFEDQLGTELDGLYGQIPDFIIDDFYELKDAGVSFYVSSMRTTNTILDINEMTREKFKPIPKDKKAVYEL